MVGFGVIIPVLPFIAINMGATPFYVGLLIASYSLMQFIFSPIWGSLSDKYGRKPILLIGLFGFTVTFILFGLANSFWMLFLARMAGGILSSACLPSAMAYVADTTSEEERGGGMGLIGAAMGLGLIFGPALGGLSSIWHVGTPFFVSAGIAGINFFFTLFFLKESRKRHSASKIRYNNFGHLLSLRGYMAFIFFLAFLLSYSISSFEVMFPMFAKQRFNFGSFEVGAAFTLMGIIGVVIQGLIIGRLIKAAGEGLVIKIGILLTALGIGLSVFSFNFISLMFFLGVAVVGQGFMRPSLASLISKNTELEEGSTMGLMQSVESLGRIVGPLAGGYLLQIGLLLPYSSTGALNFIFLALSIVFL